jgi:hypothetical protein
MFSSAARTAASRFATRAAIASRPAVTAQPSAMTLRYFAGSVSQIFVLDTSNNLEVHVVFLGLVLLGRELDVPLFIVSY